MKTFTITRTIKTDRLPELKPLVGKKVTITVKEQAKRVGKEVKKAKRNHTAHAVAPCGMMPLNIADPDDIYRNAKPIEDLDAFLKKYSWGPDPEFDKIIANLRHGRNGRKVDL